MEKLKPFKKYNWRVKRKQWAVYYGAGTSTSTGFFETKKQADFFCEWIIKSDYSRIDNECARKSYWKYQDSLAI